MWTKLKERLPALVRDLVTFSSKVLKMLGIVFKRTLNVKEKKKRKKKVPRFRSENKNLAPQRFEPATYKLRGGMTQKIDIES
jgi:hypothetical protein